MDEKARRAAVSFSSEAPYRRWYGDEILRHDKGAVDLSRFTDLGASALFNHNPYFIAGRVENARLENKRGRADIVFDDDEEGNKVFDKVKSGSLRGVSVGYQITKGRRVEEDEEFEGVKGPALIALKWTPYEISLTPIPADASVGVGRAAVRSLDGIEIVNLQKSEDDMTPEEIKQLVEGTLDGLVPRVADEVQAKMAEDAKPKPKETHEVLADVAARARAVGPECVARITEMYVAGKTEAEMLRFITEQATASPDARDFGDLGAGIPDDKKPPTGKGRCAASISFPTKKATTGFSPAWPPPPWV